MLKIGEKVALRGVGEKNPGLRNRYDEQHIVRIAPRSKDRLQQRPLRGARWRHRARNVEMRRAQCRGNRKSRLRVRKRKRDWRNVTNDNPIARHEKTRTIPSRAKMEQGIGVETEKPPPPGEKASKDAEATRKIS